jgi:hypothetical protein
MNMGSWNSEWRRTGCTGVYVRGGAYRIRVRITEPMSGHRREANRVIRSATLEQAAERRRLLEALERLLTLAEDSV